MLFVFLFKITDRPFLQLDLTPIILFPSGTGNKKSSFSKQKPFHKKFIMLAFQITVKTSLLLLGWLTLNSGKLQRRSRGLSLRERLLNSVRLSFLMLLGILSILMGKCCREQSMELFYCGRVISLSVCCISMKKVLWNVIMDALM